MDVGKDMMLQMYRSMQRIRQFETKIRDLTLANELPGFVHVSIGEEASATGVCAALRKTDRITSTHRGHGHLIAKGGQLKRMMAEILRQAHRLLQRQGRLDAYRRLLAGNSRRQRDRRRRDCRSPPAPRWPR